MSSSSSLSVSTCVGVSQAVIDFDLTKPTFSAAKYRQTTELTY